METITFDQAIEGLLSREGGLVDDPDDSGGVTKYGISLAFLRRTEIDLTGDGIVNEDDIRALTLPQAKKIYRDHFWNWSRCGDLPGYLALMVFDFGVNAGRERAARLLQSAIRKLQTEANYIFLDDYLKVDGRIGPKTIHAVTWFNHAGPVKLAAAFLAKVLAHYPSCKTWKTHGRGWMNRWASVLEVVSKIEGGA